MPCVMIVCKVLDQSEMEKNTYALKTPRFVASTFVYEIEFHIESYPAGRKQKARFHLHQSLPSCCFITTIHLNEKPSFDLVTLTFDL